MTDEVKKEEPQKKRGRPKRALTGDVQVPKEPKAPKHKVYKKAEKKVVEDYSAQIDWDQFEKLCGYQCTQEEISDFFRISEEQLIQSATRRYKRPFEKIYKIFSAPGLCSLRRSQFVIAKSNSQMAIWLGKIYLGQVDPAHQKAEEIVDRLASVLEEIDEETKRLIAQKDELNGSIF